MTVTCTPIDVDGTTVLARGAGELTDLDREALAALVEATQRAIGDRQPLPGVLSPSERIRFRRCQYCEFHTPTMGHHPDCPYPARKHSPAAPDGAPPYPIPDITHEWHGPRCDRCRARMNAWGRRCHTCELNDEKEAPDGA